MSELCSRSVNSASKTTEPLAACPLNTPHLPPPHRSPGQPGTVLPTGARGCWDCSFAAVSPTRPGHAPQSRPHHQIPPPDPTTRSHHQIPPPDPTTRPHHQIPCRGISQEQLFAQEVKLLLVLVASQSVFALHERAVRAAAVQLRGRLQLVHIDPEEPSSAEARDYFGFVRGGSPLQILGYAFDDDSSANKYMPRAGVATASGTELTGALVGFGDEVVSGTAQPMRKSEAPPARNEGGAVVVVGDTFDEIVKAPRDVLLEVYAPWCGHCKQLAPVYEQLGERFAGVGSVTIAKSNGCQRLPAAMSPFPNAHLPRSTPCAFPNAHVPRSTPCAFPYAHVPRSTPCAFPNAHLPRSTPCVGSGWDRKRSAGPHCRGVSDDHALHSREQASGCGGGRTHPRGLDAVPAGPRCDAL